MLSARTLHARATTVAAPEDAPSRKGAQLTQVLDAWSEMPGTSTVNVHQLTSRMRSVVRSYRLTSHDADDVVQTTWLRLLEQVDQIREPRALGGWVQTTARRESLRVLGQAARTSPVEPAQLQDRVAHGRGDARPDEAARDAVRRDIAIDCALEALPAAIGDLPGHQRDLMRMLTATPAPSYADISRELEIPIGSIGPTRARSLQRLRSDPRLATLAWHAEAA